MPSLWSHHKEFIFIYFYLPVSAFYGLHILCYTQKGLLHAKVLKAFTIFSSIECLKFLFFAFNYYFSDDWQAVTRSYIKLGYFFLLTRDAFVIYWISIYLDLSVFHWFIYLWTSTTSFNWASLVAQMAKNPTAMWKTWVWSLHWEDPLEEGMAIHSSILAWRIPGTEEPGRLQSKGLRRVGHKWAINILINKALQHILTSWQG